MNNSYCSNIFNVIYIQGNQDGSDQGPPRKVRRTVEEKLKMTNTVVVCRRITEEVLIGDKVVDRKQWQVCRESSGLIMIIVNRYIHLVQSLLHIFKPVN